MVTMAFMNLATTLLGLINAIVTLTWCITYTKLVRDYHLFTVLYSKPVLVLVPYASYNQFKLLKCSKAVCNIP